MKTTITAAAIIACSISAAYAADSLYSTPVAQPSAPTYASIPSFDDPWYAQPTYMAAPSRLASIGAGMLYSPIVSHIYRIVTRPNYERDYNFNGGEYFLRWEDKNPDQVKLITLANRRELEQAKSQLDFDAKLQEFADKRDADFAGEVNPLSNALGQLLPLGAVALLLISAIRAARKYMYS